MEQEETKTDIQKELDAQKDKYGRKTVMTPSVLVKLEQAFSLGCSDLEACYYAGIGKSTLYDYQKLHLEFSERKEELKSKPVLLARQTVMKGITGYEIKDENGKTIKVINAPDPKLALDFLKNKMYKEFKQGVELNDVTTYDPNSLGEFLGRFKKVKEDSGMSYGNQDSNQSDNQPNPVDEPTDTTQNPL